MEEEDQAQQEPKEPLQMKKEPQQVTKEPQQVTTKDPKKVEAGKRLAAINCKKREEAQNGRMNQYYGIAAGFSHAFSAILAVGVIGGLGYHIYRTKKGGVQAQVESNLQTHNKIILNHAPRLTSLRWFNLF